MDYKKIIEFVKYKNLVSRTIILVVSVFILALNYNLFLSPNNIVVGGTSGLAIITKSVFGWNDAIFLNVTGIILVILSFILLGKEKTAHTIVGALLYPFFVFVTKPLAAVLLPYIVINDFLIIVLIISLVMGIFNGIIYKAGFTTGGSDILMQIATKYLHISEGKSNFITNIVIVVIGGIVFGINRVIYASIILYISSILINKIMIGISESKMFFIHTVKSNEIKDFIINKMNTGVTLLKAEGGYSGDKSEILMCVVPTRDYYYFKEIILTIDAETFLVINDCYEAKGGVKRENLPFM